MLTSTLAKSNRRMTFVVICWAGLCRNHREFQQHEILAPIQNEPLRVPGSSSSGAGRNAKIPSGVAYYTILCQSSHCNLIYNFLLPLQWFLSDDTSKLSPAGWTVATGFCLHSSSAFMYNATLLLCWGIYNLLSVGKTREREKIYPPSFESLPDYQGLSGVAGRRLCMSQSNK